MTNPWHWMRGIEGTGPQPVAFGAKVTKAEVFAEAIKTAKAEQIKPDADGMVYVQRKGKIINFLPAYDDADYSTEIMKAAQETGAAELQKQKERRILDAYNDEATKVQSDYLKRQDEAQQAYYHQVMAAASERRKQSLMSGLLGTDSESTSLPPVSQVSRETQKLSRETESLPPSDQALEKTGEDANPTRQGRIKTYLGMDVIVDPTMAYNSYRLEPQWRVARMDQVFYDGLRRLRDYMTDENG